MNRAREMLVAQALNEAIWLRDNIYNITREEAYVEIDKIGKLNVFSSRQLSAITNGVIDHNAISRKIHKTDRTGGKLNVGTLDILKAILLSRADEKTDFALIAEAVGLGTSQGMVSKLTGVSQSSISRRLEKK